MQKRLFAAATMIILLSGCMVGPDYQRPPVTTPDVGTEQRPDSFATTFAFQGFWWKCSESGSGTRTTRTP